ERPLAANQADQLSFLSEKYRRRSSLIPADGGAWAGKSVYPFLPVGEDQSDIGAGSASGQSFLWPDRKMPLPGGYLPLQRRVKARVGRLGAEKCLSRAVRSLRWPNRTLAW